MTALDNILTHTREQIDALRAESADHAREATKLAEQMAAPTDAYRAMESEHRDLLLKVAALETEMRTAKAALDAMADERKTHLDKADAAADCADHFETRTLPGLAEILDGADIPPREALTATGLMPKDIPVEEHTCANMGCTSCAGCDGCTCHDPAHTCLPWDASTQTECDGCMDAARAEVARADDLTAPGVADTRAQIAPHLPITPPVPHDPAGVIVATTVTMPDTGLNPDPLPPAPPTAEPRHAKPKGSRLTGGFKALISKPEQDGDA